MQRNRIIMTELAGRAPRSVPPSQVRALSEQEPAGASVNDTVSFTVSGPGGYEYVCPLPGHAQMGMHGSFTVR
jgi:plastocyanin